MEQDDFNQELAAAGPEENTPEETGSAPAVTEGTSADPESHAEEDVTPEPPDDAASSADSETPGEAAELPGSSDTSDEPAKSGGFRQLLKKWWFWLIVAAVVGGVIYGVTDSSGDSGSSSGDSGSSVSVPYVDPFVTLVKTATNSTYGITYGAAFDSFFTSPKWRSFTSTSGNTVVEFTGGFLYSGSPATATFQFVLDFGKNQMSIEYLEINGVAQTRLMLATFVKKVFESY